MIDVTKIIKGAFDPIDVLDINHIYKMFYIDEDITEYCWCYRIKHKDEYTNRLVAVFEGLRYECSYYGLYGIRHNTGVYKVYDFGEV